MMILAIDLGQSKSVSCEFDTVNGDFRFKTFDTTGALVRKVPRKSQANQVVIEICPLPRWCTTSAVSWASSCWWPT